MRRVLIFSLNYHPFIGGAEIALKEITDRIAPEDIEFHLIAYRFDSKLPKREQVGNVTVHRIGIGRRGMTIGETFTSIAYLGKVLYVPLAAMKAWRLNRKQRFDAAWAMMSYMVFPLVLLRLAGTRIPYLLTLQEGDPFERVFGRWRIRLVKPLLTLGIRRAAAVQAISTFLLDWARRIGFEGHGQVIPNGVDLARFAHKIPDEVVSQTKEWLGKKPGDVFLVTTSRLVHKNGIDTVLGALALLPSHVHFVVLGEGPLEGALKAKAAGLKVSERVRFMGALPHADLPAALSACDIFIRPSRSEGMGNSFIEAMAAGLPVIATQEGGLADFLFDAKRNPGKEATGWAVDANHPEQVAAAVEAILADPQQAAQTIANARHLAHDHYDWNPIARRMHELLERVGEQSRNPRLLIATPLYPPEPGGPATHTKLLEAGLPGHGITVAVEKFAAVRRYPKVVRHLWYFMRLTLAARRADVLLVQDTVSCGVPAVCAAKLTKTPLIMRVPGDYAWEQGRQRFGVSADLDAFQTSNPPFRVNVLKKLQGWVARSAHTVIVPSRYFAGIVSQWGVAPGRLKVVYHGMQAVKDVSMPEGLPSRPFMVSAGRLVPWKGFDFLIGLLPQLPEWQLVIIGDGPQRAALERQARSLGVAERVKFTGAIRHADVLGWCGSADAFVLNTSFESFSFQVLEAMAVGAPVITTAIGSIPELITDGREGVLLAPNDSEGFLESIRSIRGVPDLWRERQEAARRRAREFSQERMLDETSQLVRAAV